MTTIPDEIMELAEKTLDLMLCNCREAGDVRQDSIRNIAIALNSIAAERDKLRDALEAIASPYAVNTETHMETIKLARRVLRQGRRDR